MPLSRPCGQVMLRGSVLPSALASIVVGIRKSSDAGLAFTCQPSAMFSRTRIRGLFWSSVGLTYCAETSTLDAESANPAAYAVVAPALASHSAQLTAMIRRFMVVRLIMIALHWFA